MTNKQNSIEISLPSGNIIFETGKIARQANGAVLVRQGETVVFASACATKEPNPTVDFLPLRVDYQEKFSSAGKTVSGFIKREGRPSERDILTSRLIDRSLRPMFENGYYNEIQIFTSVWSSDLIHSADSLAICAASAALTLSDIPLSKPIAGIRLGLINDEFIVNPTMQQQKESELDLMIAGTEDAILMIEGYCDFLSEEKVLEAIEQGHAAIKEICSALSQWQQQIGKPKYRESLRIIPQEIIDEVKTIATPMLEKAFNITEKLEREKAQKELHTTVMEKLCPECCSEADKACDPTLVSLALKKVSSEIMRSIIINKKIRCDKRSTTEIRPITIEQEILPRVHGSSLFTRGETQAVATCTLGGENMGQRFETIEEEGTRKFYLQYFFPPYSVGEVGRTGPPNRREIGHGKLAERALKAALPPPDKFPYTIRLESNITESNGSSSMASVCGCCLAMMAAGVPIKSPIAGIAMGLILEKDQHIILSDILGIEDALGDMDFKITGNHEGITAFQMDIKIEGITHDIMRDALMQAKDGRNHILQKMTEACPSPKSGVSKHVPRISAFQIDPNKIGLVIGPGGKQIRNIIEETGVEINISDDGLVNITSQDDESMQKAKDKIQMLVAEAKKDEIYEGKVVSIKPFGAFIEILPGKEGLCHISELSDKRIENIEKFLKTGDKITVKVLEIDNNGRIKLSRKATLAQ